MKFFATCLRDTTQETSAAAPAAVTARQLANRDADAAGHAGEVCSRSGQPAVTNWDARPKLIPTKKDAGQLRGRLLCQKCGAVTSVQRPWSGPGDRRSVV